jgi:hypothetical protein
MKASVRQIQANIEALEIGLEVEARETDDPREQANWARVQAVIPDQVVVEVLLEYLLQEVSYQSISADSSVTGYGNAAISSDSGKPLSLATVFRQPEPACFACP